MCSDFVPSLHGLSFGIGCRCWPLLGSFCKTGYITEAPQLQATCIQFGNFYEEVLRTGLPAAMLSIIFADTSALCARARLMAVQALLLYTLNPKP